MNAWELTDEEIEAVTGETFRFVNPDERAIASAAVKKYQEWLASQCGPEPCEKKCDALLMKAWPKHPELRYCTAYPEPYDCPIFMEHKGQIQGYAKGLQERGK